MGVSVGDIVLDFVGDCVREDVCDGVVVTVRVCEGVFDEVAVFVLVIVDVAVVDRVSGVTVGERVGVCVLDGERDGVRVYVDDGVRV